MQLILRVLLLSAVLLQIATIVHARQDLYKTLGVPKTASQKDVTKAYRKLALKHHPDKVPEPEREASEKKFKEIGYANDVLGDKEKRERYDRYGEQGLDDNFHPGFSKMGGHGNGASQSPFGASQNGFNNQQSFSFGGGGPHSPQGAGDMGIDIGDILRQFMGSSGGMAGMNGNGMGMNGNGMPRSGSGMNFEYGGPGMGGTNGMGMGGSASSHQHQHPKKQEPLKPQTKEFYCTLGELSDMNGCSKLLKVSIPTRNVDPMTGQQTQQKMEKIYTIDVKPGWKEGTKIKFKASTSTDGNGQFRFPPMTFVLKEKKHKYIKRAGDDLVYKCEVTERQAERGAKLKIPLPDGEVLEVKTEPDEIHESYTKRVEGKGMPVRSEKSLPMKRGDFLIEFRIRKQTQSEKTQV